MSSPNRMMNGNELRSVWESGLDLHLVNHFGDAIHDIAAAQQGGTKAHELRDAFAVAGAFEDLEGNDGDRLWIVELEAARLPPPGEIGGDDDEKLLLFAG